MKGVGSNESGYEFLKRREDFSFEWEAGRIMEKWVKTTNTRMNC